MQRTSEKGRAAKQGTFRKMFLSCTRDSRSMAKASPRLHRHQAQPEEPQGFCLSRGVLLLVRRREHLPVLLTRRQMAPSGQRTAGV